MGGPEKVETGRGSAGLVRGRDEGCQADETNRKGKGKGIGGKGEHGSKGGFGSKGEAQDVGQHEEEERVLMAPNMEAGGSHPQAMTDPEKEKGKREKREGRRDKEDMGGLRRQRRSKGGRRTGDRGGKGGRGARRGGKGERRERDWRKGDNR